MSIDAASAPTPGGVRLANPTRPWQAGVAFLALLVGVLVFATLRIRVLPCDAGDVFYLFSLEDGVYTAQEWMHPLWVPLLSCYRAILGIFGWHGHMLVPVEVLNVGIACLTCFRFFQLARRLTPNPVVWVVASLAIFNLGHFSEAAVRPTPYALGFLFVMKTIAALSTEKSATLPGLRRAGIFAGLAASLHLSAISLVFVALIRLRHEPRRMRGLLVFVSTQFGVLAICTALFMLRNHISPGFFIHADLRALFPAIEQVHGTSIYSSHSISGQLIGIAESVSQHQDGGLLMLCLIVWLIGRTGRAAPAESSEPGGPRQRLISLGFANLAAFLLFFAVNNSQNGFVFAAFAPLPIFLAIAAGKSRRGAWTLSVLGVPLLLSTSAWIIEAGNGCLHDSILCEERFLAGALRPNDIVLTPACPFVDVQYLAPLNLVFADPDTDSRMPCFGPRMSIDGTLRARVEWWIQHGSRVYFALGDDEAASGTDADGGDKEHQIFWSTRTGALLARSRTRLEGAGLVLGTPLVSPERARYALVEVRQPTGASAVQEPRRLPRTAADLQERFATRHRPQEAYRAAALVHFDDTIPGDPWLSCDLLALICQGERGIDPDLEQFCEPWPGCESIGTPTPAPPRGDTP